MRPFRIMQTSIKQRVFMKYRTQEDHTPLSRMQSGLQVIKEPVGKFFTTLRIPYRVLPTLRLKIIYHYQRRTLKVSRVTTRVFPRTYSLNHTLFTSVYDHLKVIIFPNLTLRNRIPSKHHRFKKLTNVTHKLHSLIAVFTHYLSVRLMVEKYFSTYIRFIIDGRF